MSLADIKAKIAAREAAAAAARDEQLAKDLEALDALQEAHGVAGVLGVPTPAAPPLPTTVYIIPPDRRTYDYWAKTMRRPGSTVTEKTEADTDLANKVVVYPDKDTWKDLVEKHPAMVSSVVNAAGKLAGLAVGDSGKE